MVNYEVLCSITDGLVLATVVTSGSSLTHSLPQSIRLALMLFASQRLSFVVDIR